MLRLTFLGTGTSQGVPMIGCNCKVCSSSDTRDKRLRTSAMIEDEHTRIIIDAGPDFRYQMLRADVRDIDAILLTHQHTDHIMGLDDVRAFNYFCRKSIPVWATEGVQAVVRKNFDYAFSEPRYPGAPEITLNTIGCEPFSIGTLDITPIHGFHLSLPVVGFRVGDVAYLTDFNRISDSEVEKLKGLKVFVVNALRHQRHLSHFSLSGAMELARKVGAEQTYFTHMSHQIGLHAEQDALLPVGFNFAYDGLIVEV
ncbi:MAG: MBL fold metallo-hydrolase [Tidjanibacter sp.]|nr:MBL fold metallo-hydrolase [Tidjanibacter sp.]